MTFPSKRSGWTWVFALLCALLFAGTLRPQQSADSGLELTTQERLETEAWWPTMAVAPLTAYAGSAACAACHTEGAGTNAMKRAALKAEDDPFLRPDHPVTAHDAGFHYVLEQAAHGIDYSVSGDGETLTRKLAWVIGAGELGRTFLYEDGGRWQQSQVTFYTGPAALGITTGLGRVTGTGLPAALGQPLTGAEARACFGCHTVHATTSAGLNPAHAEAGVGCEACHGPALKHVQQTAAAAGQPARAPASSTPAVFDPGKLSPEASIDFCGACHRTSADAKLSTTLAFGTSVIRFQPYRLEESKCWRATRDQRLTCVACHNPHQPLNRDTLSYDRQCLGCHSTPAGHPASHSATTTAATTVARVCPRATSACVSCHMPKVQIATMHGDFTDHFIRVVKAGDLAAR